METTRRVAIGGTFACDEALAVPLQYLLKNAVWNVDVALQWLRYGSLADFDEWSADVRNAAHPVDLVLLLVRLSDLEAAHPELYLAKKSGDDAGADDLGAEVADGHIGQFLLDLERYDTMAAGYTAAPLVVLLCPSPPAAAAKFGAVECEMLSKIGAMQSVTVKASGRLMGLFQQQYRTAFYDAVADKRQHSPYTQDMLNVLSLSLCRQICRLFRTASNRKKVIVLDCDNTLWGGAVAEVGASGIDLGPRFLALQRFVVAQQQRGILLALCSKNIIADVREAFKQRRGDMVLDMDKHVVATKVNWQPKSRNIAQLAKELSLGLDSFIFIDDNPLECSEVSTALPSVTVIPLGADFSESLLDEEWVFDDDLSTHSRTSTASTSTKEDSQRTQLYQQNLQREQLRESSSTHKAFLGALGVRIVFEELACEQELRERSSSFARTLQIHHRTNQFNTATTFTKRMKEKSLLKYVTAPDHTVICAHVTDRFGHYGLVSVALCQRVRGGDVLRVDSFLLSCRALNRGVEHAMLRRLSEVAARTGAALLEFTWEPTERNQPARAFFSILSDAMFATTNAHPSKTVGNDPSISNFGTWVISADKARQVSFLKAEDSSHHHVIKAGGLTEWLLRLGSAYWCRDAALSMIRWILSFVPLPRSIARLLQLSLVQQPVGAGITGMLRVPLRDSGSLEQFLGPALSDIPNVVVSGADNEDSNDKFRRKARHQTKLALVKHLHEEVPSVIWSANRPYTDGSKAPVGSNLIQETEPSTVAGRAIRLQLVCESAQCSAAIQRESRCEFQRCRNCCYRVQRLLTRSLHHVNAAARQSALNALQEEFAVNASLVAVKDGQVSGSDTQWCQAHQNKRRRGEICTQKSKGD